MGLPIWRNYKEEALASAKAAAKPDPTATARSSIRRRPSVHGGVAHAAPRTFQANGHTWRMVGPHDDNYRDTSPPLPPPVPESRNYFERSSGTGRPRSRRERSTNIRLVGNRGSSSRGPQPDHEEAAQLARATRRHRLESLVGAERADQLDNPTLDRVDTLRPSMTPPIPTVPRLTRAETLRDTITVRPRSQNGSRRPTLPTPPLDSAESPERPSSRRLPTPSRPSGWDSPPSMLMPLSWTPASPDNDHAWRPTSPPNGLGDRVRSPSALSQQGDAWEVIRSTIQPDDSLPSAESTFASTAASASFTNNTNAANAESLSTAPTHLRRETDELSAASIPDLECVWSDSDGSDADRTIRPDEELTQQLANDPILREQWMDEEQLRARLRIQRRQAATDRQNLNGRARERLPRNQSDMVEMLVRRAEAGISDATLMRQSLRDPRGIASATEDAYQAALAAHLGDRAVDGPIAPSVRDSQSADRDAHTPLAQSREALRSSSDLLSEMSANLARDETDLEQMRGILERLAHREDIPEEWWMSAGLSLAHTRERTRTMEERVRFHEERAAGRRTAQGAARSANRGRL